MGFQSGINAALGTVAGAAFGISKTLQDRLKQSMQKVDEKKAAALKLRRNFMDYLRKQPVSGGGTVGDLPINVLKQIASTYSKADRKKLMDRGDSK